VGSLKSTPSVSIPRTATNIPITNIRMKVFHELLLQDNNLCTHTCIFQLFLRQMNIAIHLCGYISAFIIFDFGLILHLVTCMYTCCTMYSHTLIFGKMFYTHSNSIHDNKVTSENCALLGYYTVSCGNFLPTGDNLSDPGHWKEITITCCLIPRRVQFSSTL
jgi:hypothetical protein